MVKIILAENPYNALEFASNELKSDRDVVEKSFMKSSKALKFADKSII